MPLPPAAAGTPEIVEVARGARKSDLPALPPDVMEEMAKEVSPERRIAVPKDLSHPHPVIRAWLEERQRQRQALVNSPSGVVLAPQRMTRSERRRLRILSTLFRALDARGHKIVADPKDHHHLAVMVGQEKVEFTLTLRQRQIKRPLKAEEKAEWFNAMTGRQFSMEQQTTDELVFRTRSVWWPDRRVKKEWSDKPDRPLEQQLNDIVAGLIAAAAVQREQRISQEEAARRRRQEELERWKRQEAEEAEAHRFEELVRQVGRWRQANELRAYVKAVKARARAAGDRASRTHLREWAAWALRHADCIDPTISIDVPRRRPQETPSQKQRKRGPDLICRA